jgi:hypothetical protein
MNSMESMTLSGCSSWRRIHTRLSVEEKLHRVGISSSSLRVADLLMSRHGKMRFSMSLRSRWISLLPVPLNSSKITSSMREPVSTRAVAMMVSEPPSSMLRAAEEALGLVQRVGVDAAREDLARRRHHGVVGAGEAGDRVEQDDHVLLVLDEALGLLDDHLGHLHVARGGLVEGRADDLAAHRALHVGDLLGPLVDEQHDEHRVGVVVAMALAIVLQQHGLAGAGRRDDEAALALARWAPAGRYAGAELFFRSYSRLSSAGGRAA